MTIEKKKVPFLLINIIFLISTLIFLGLSIHSQDLSRILSVFLLIDSLWLCYISRKNKILLMMFFILFYCNYSIVFSRYLFWNDNRIISDFYVKNITEIEMSIGIMCLFDFTSILTILFSFYDVKEFNIPRSNYNDLINNIVSIVLIVFLIVIFIFGFEWQYGSRGSTTAIFEYSIIFFILLLYFNHGSKFLNLCQVVIAILYIVVPLFYGERISAFQFLLAIYFFKF